MDLVNSAWVRGEENLHKMLEALLESDYQVRVIRDEDSKTLLGVTSYFLTWVDRKYAGVSFEAVDEYDKFVEREQGEE